MLPTIKPSKKLIYLDHAATTPLDPKVKKAMDPYWIRTFGNPSSLYREGRGAQGAVEKSRQAIAAVLGARPEEIIFTAGGTESVNFAIFGIARKPGLGRGAHFITTAVEHHAVLHSFDALKREGFQTSVVGVDSEGFVNLNELKAAVRPETVFISVIYANNEIGTVQPVAAIGKWIKKLNQERAVQKLPRICFHTDACQAAGALDLNVERLGADLMSVNGSKVYGPKQTGVLYVRRGVHLEPLVYGGGQERGMRSGTENVPGIVGLAEALESAEKNREKENRHLTQLRDYLITQLLSKVPGTVLNGPNPVNKNVAKIRGRENRQINMRRLPNNVNVSIEGVEGESLMLYLDSYNIAVSTGSACTTSSVDPSHVLLALGRSREQSLGAVRFSLGKSTTRKEVEYVMKVLPGVVKELRRVNSSLDS